MNSKDFELTINGYIKYPDVNNETSHIYIGDYDETVTVEKLEKDFEEMLDECGSDCDAKDRKALIAFAYYSVLCCKEF